ncbi:MAG: hypothetical protein NZO16_02885, partial [Deltaproteobacteria bacterium]|nr:hypothetical protein [Deltaproteobacteria bacterium]
MLNKKGASLIASLMLSLAVLAVLAAVGTTTLFDLKSTLSLRSATTGFFSAEAGLNLRANAIREVFVGYNVPQGTAPSTSNPCSPSNMGSGDFACQEFSINSRRVITYIRPDPGNPRLITIPTGELYQGLTA